ncbi:MAG: helix-turn-helix transcriptional regulator [Clostridia bacterium]|nr:helix-turn-helix transcriptional regulator [Clostridia bacterium]
MNDLNLYEKMPVEEKNFPIRLVAGSTRNGLVPHWHEHLEMILFKAGGCTVTSGGQSFDVIENDFVIVNSNDLHYFDKCETGVFSSVIINPSFFADVDFENILLQPHIRGDKTVKNCVEQMFMEKYERKAGYDMEIKSLAYRLMTHLLRNYTAERLSEGDALVRRNKIRRIGNIIHYISTCYNNKITTATLAQQFNMNEHYLCHFFKAETGQSPISYINRYRIDKAAVLLQSTDRSITEIAMNVGFDDTNYFTRTFKKHMNMTPTKYKKMCGN